jgi:hypothetical protein
MKSDDVFSLGILIYTVMTLLDPHYLLQKPDKPREQHHYIAFQQKFRQRTPTWPPLFQPRDNRDYWIKELVDRCL